MGKPRKKKSSDRWYLIAKRTMMAVILLAMFAVMLGALSLFFIKPENIVKQKVEEIAKDYYENYFYQKILDNAPSNKTMGEILKKYVKTGFTEMPLRQLILFDNQRHVDMEETFEKYCDLDDTVLHFYPVEPFGVTDYRVEYKYACIF